MRQAKINRKTEETNIKVNLKLDGRGKSKLNTGKRFFDHLLSTFCFHGMFDLEVKAEGGTVTDDHHLVEDVGLTLGQAFNKALGEKSGINRFGSAVVPMDDALVLVSVDLSGRVYFESSLEFKYPRIGDMASQMVNHFLKSLSEAGRFNLHVIQLRGFNDHHKAEAAFKALGLALAGAARHQTSRGKMIPSLKGAL